MLLKELIQHICPETSPEHIAAILDMAIPSTPVPGILVESEDLCAMLGEDAALFEEAQQPPSDELQSIREEIQAAAASLRQGHSRQQVAGQTVHWQGTLDQTWAPEARPW